MENQNDNTLTSSVSDEVATTTIAPATLPTFTVCFAESWNFVRDRFDVFVFLLITTLPSLFLTIALELNENFFLENGWLGLVLVLVSMVITPFVYLAVLYTALYHETRPTLRQALQYVGQNFWAYAWLFTLAGLVILSGFVLFIIPGVILSILLAFAGSVFVVEGRRGMAVLQQSHALVRDYWWGIALRIFGISFLWGFISGFISAFGLVGLALSSLIQIISIMTLLYVVAMLYHARSTAVKSESVSLPKPSFYYTFIAFGGLIIVGLLGFLVALLLGLVLNG